MNENELAKIAVDIAFKIHTALGPGILESAYEAAFVYELEKRNVPYTRQEGIRVVYDNVVLDVGFRADIIIDNKVLVELKSVEQINKIHHKITVNYMRLKKIKLGLLINFNEVLIKNGIYRKIDGDLT
ncbi:MAG: GxxExxY protein [Bacteroidetes bacterium]|nr:GxxExxY protein [Bacteroidota bacterium]